MGAEKSAKLDQISMSWVLHKQMVMEVLRQLLILSRGDRKVPRLRFGIVENVDSNHPMNGLLFGDIYDTMKREVRRNKTKRWFGKKRMQ